MPAKATSVQQLPLVPGVTSVYEGREREIWSLVGQAIAENALTLELVARLAGMASEQLSRALAGRGTHVPTRVYGVLLDPAVDAKRVFITGLGRMAKCDVRARPDLSDEEFRRRVERFSQRSDMGALFLRDALGEDR